jgi:hypothetical protein
MRVHLAETRPSPRSFPSRLETARRENRSLGAADAGNVLFHELLEISQIAVQGAGQ